MVHGSETISAGVHVIIKNPEGLCALCHKRSKGPFTSDSGSFLQRQSDILLLGFHLLSPQVSILTVLLQAADRYDSDTKSLT